MKKSRRSFLSLSLAIVLCFSLALTAADGTIAAKTSPARIHKRPRSERSWAAARFSTIRRQIIVRSHS
jgi:hypothetical protein